MPRLRPGFAPSLASRGHWADRAQACIGANYTEFRYFRCDRRRKVFELLGGQDLPGESTMSPESHRLWEHPDNATVELEGWASAAADTLDERQGLIRARARSNGGHARRSASLHPLPRTRPARHGG